jgi:uncharacterized protein YxjI
MMREKLFSFGDDYSIRDEVGREVYFVDGKVLRIRQTLEMLDASGREVAVIRKRLISLGPVYEITRGNSVSVLSKHLFTLFRAKFTLDVPGPGDLEASGSFLEHEFSFTRDGRTVATASKRWFKFADTYGIDVAEGEDDVLILASAVAIDLCLHPDNND